jgi:hypothetical protein
MVRKNISPDYFGLAKNTTEYLFYTLKAAEEYQDYSEHSGTGHIDLDFHEETHNQALLDESAAKEAWKKIRKFYPDAPGNPNN